MRKRLFILSLILFVIICIYLILQVNLILADIASGFASLNPAQMKATYRVAFIYQNNNQAFWKEVKRGARAATKGESIYVNFMESTKGQELQLVDYLRLAIDTNYQGIIIQGDDESSLPFIAEAWQAKIPTLTVVSDLPDSGRLAYVGTNNYYAGYVAGKILCQSIKKEQPKLAILSPLRRVDLKSSVAESIKIFGFREAISRKETNLPLWKKSNPTLIDSLITVRTLLQKEPQLDGIYATYPEGTLAVARAIFEKNLQQQIKVLGSGDLPEIREYLKNETLTASIVEYPYQIGYQAVREMLLYLREKRINVSNNIDVIILDRNRLEITGASK